MKNELLNWFWNIRRNKIKVLDDKADILSKDNNAYYIK